MVNPMGMVMAKSVVTLVRSLKPRRGRARQGLAVLEGVRLVEEALRARVVVRGVVCSPALEATPRGRALKTALAGAPLTEVSGRALEELASTEHPQGVIAVIEPRSWQLEQIRPGSRGVVLVLDGIQDPGNVGTIIRTAHALGAAGVVALPGTVDLCNPKVLRGAMGASFHLPAVPCDDAGFRRWLALERVSLQVAAVGGVPISRAGLSGPFALVLGNEGVGVRPALLELAAGQVAIPMRPGVESLNVAVAAGILLWEVLRER